MKVIFRRFDYYEDKKSWHFIFPSFGIGYYGGFISIALYFLIWEFSVNFDLENKL